LKRHYGEEVSFKLVSRRNSRQGLVLKVAVRNSSASSGNWRVRYATCRVPRGGEGDITVDDADPAANGARE
jgi:hypothetical protein